MGTVTKVYQSHWQARNAVAALEEADIPALRISMLATRTSAEAAETSAAATGAGVGAVVGGGAGLLAGLGFLAIPGLGPIIAAGWLASTAVGAVTGGATGGIVGALVDAGEAENYAHIYSEAVRRGGTLVSVITDETRAAEVLAILNRFNPSDPDRLAEEYRKAGWDRFDPNAEPYETEAELERKKGLR